MLQRRIGCIYYAFINKKFTQNGNTACWAGIRSYLHNKGPKYIYITQYDEKETKEYQKLLVSLINKITPCVFLKRQNVIYIKYQLLENHYNRNLVLLNFIRNLWDNPLFPYNENYTKKFFESVKKSKKKDPLEILTEANMIACEGTKILHADHSNAAKNTKIKTSEDLLNKESDIQSTNYFLTT